LEDFFNIFIRQNNIIDMEMNLFFEGKISSHHFMATTQQLLKFSSDQTQIPVLFPVPFSSVYQYGAIIEILFRKNSLFCPPTASPLNHGSRSSSARKQN
jgi:hypothetical protein